MELTDNDKQRIEQFALSQFPDMDDVRHCSRNYGCIIGAEYATIYEREQQAKEQIESEANALLLVKLLDLSDRCYHYMRITPPDKTKMIYNEWEEILDHLKYYKSEYYDTKRFPPDNETVEDGGGCYVAGSREEFQNAMDGPYVDFSKPNIFMDGDNNSYSLMTSSDPEKREKGKQIRIHELTSRIKQLEDERSELVKKNGILKIKNTEMESIRHINKELANQIDELRNKVIEEIDKYYQENVFTLPTTDAEQCILALKAAYQFILSLKTK